MPPSSSLLKTHFLAFRQGPSPCIHSWWAELSLLRRPQSCWMRVHPWPHLTLITPWMHHLYTETQRGLGLNMYFKEHKTLYILIKTLNIKFESFSFFLPPQSIKERNKKISSDPDAFSGNCFQTFKEKLLPMSHNIFHNIGKRKNIPTWFMRSA